MAHRMNVRTNAMVGNATSTKVAVIDVMGALAWHDDYAFLSESGRASESFFRYLFTYKQALANEGFRSTSRVAFWQGGRVNSSVKPRRLNFGKFWLIISALV